MDRVAIVGVGQTKYERRKKAETFADLVYEVTVKALEDAGLAIKDIDNVVTVSNDFWDGRTISSMAIQDACGSRHKDISTVEGDGLFGAFYGLMRILSGSFGTTLVVAHMKGSESRMNLITNAMFDPIYSRMLGLDAITSAAMQARAYMDRFRFQSITTEQWIDFVEAELPGVLKQVNAEGWIHGSGVPDNEPTFHSARKAAVEALAAGWDTGERPTDEDAKVWSPEEWLIYLQAMPQTVDPADCAALDEAFGLTASGNAEILAAWLGIGVRSGHAPAIARTQAFLREMGRMKFLKPLYSALAANPETKALARELFTEVKPTYHPIAQMVVDSVLEQRAV